jgi:quinoprotein dehydrogenase-associated probable ABC transporter substrate-binding protein
MSSRFPSFVFGAAAAIVIAVNAQAARGSAHDVLRVCADPNNMPFSNARQEGFENKIARLAANTLGRQVDYVWWAQRRGFVRKTLDNEACDVIVGVPAQFERALTTVPYYRSTYVFVTRRSDPRPTGLDDPRLRRATIGVHLIGDDFANVPPAHALSQRGLVSNVRGYSIYGDYSQPDPPANLIRAVASHDIDLAIAWGPLAGYFAHRSPVALAVTPVPQDAAAPAFPFAYDIAMGVRRGDVALKRALDAVIASHRSEIDSILATYDVPRVQPGGRQR